MCNSDFVPTSRTTQQIKWAIELFSHQEDMFDLSTVAEDGGFALDYQFLIENKYFCEVWPQFKADLIETPNTTLAVLSLAMYQVRKLTFFKDDDFQFYSSSDCIVIGE